MLRGAVLEHLVDLEPVDPYVLDWGSCLCLWQCCLFWFAKVHANFNPSVTVIPLSKHRCQVHSLGVSFSSSMPVAHEGRGRGRGEASRSHFLGL